MQSRRAETTAVVQLPARARTVILYLPMVLLGLDRLPCRYHLRAPSLGCPQPLSLVEQNLRS